MSQSQKPVYKTKKEIYQDYKIAVKLQLENATHISSYKQFYESLDERDRGRVEEIGWINNYKTEFPLSYGVFIEIPETTKTGKEIGVRNLMLQHETGIELFLMAGAALLLTEMAKEIGKDVIKDVAKKALEKLVDRAIDWYKSTNKGVAYIEIRTEHKGIMRVNFENFRISQLECLIDNFDNIDHLSDLNQLCFGGNLIDVDNSHD
jgi:hypothetical protein